MNKLSLEIKLGNIDINLDYTDNALDSSGLILLFVIADKKLYVSPALGHREVVERGNLDEKMIKGGIILCGKWLY